MSSLDHDRLLEERPKAPRAAARPGAETEVPTPRRTRRSSQEKAEGQRPRTTRDRAPAAGSRPPTASRATPAKKAAPATKAAPAKKAAPATKAAPAKAVAGKAAAAKVVAAKATPAKVTAKKAATATKAAPAREAAAVELPEPRTPADPAPAPAVAVVAEPVPDTGLAGAGSVPRRRLRLGAAPRRRPAVLLAAALVGALSVGVLTAGTDRAAASAAGPEGRSVSVAHALGLTAASRTAAPAAAADELRMVAASRAQRQAEETAAAQAQAAADQAAVQAAIEAARPKAVDPAPGTVLTTCFCMRWGTMHWGIDLAAPLGTPEYAAMDGVVVKAGPASGFGQAVYIQHGNGDVTVYGHMEKILVTTGQVVRAGDEIALMGAEGEATGSHLHFEVHVGGIEGQRVDPIAWLRARGVQI